MRTLNLGILAHVDAGKTTLTERLLFAAGVIDEIGRVDDGTTQTDSLPLERQRGITIKSAVVSFEIGDTTVNLIDTPGHPEFIAEVERVLGVLDAAVLVVSAVEGVQAQTRILMRALQRLRIPTVFFVNKVDRRGADPERVIRSISQRLTPSVVPMGTVEAPETRNAAFRPFADDDESLTVMLADLLSDHDDALLRDLVGGSVLPERLRAELGAQTRRALVHPACFGSAITGAGVDALTETILELLPVEAPPAAGDPAGTIFKVERGRAGERIAYLRMFSGQVRVRDRLRFRGREHTVTALRVFERGSLVPREEVRTGRIATVWGLGDVRVGDSVGAPARSDGVAFAPPTSEAAVVAVRPSEKGALFAALTQLAEQDPLIDLRLDAIEEEPVIALYGEVQKEVIEATLRMEYGIEAAFRETTTICIERVVGIGDAVEYKGRPPNPFLATVGLRVEPGPEGSGVVYGVAGDRRGTMPPAFFAAIEETVLAELAEGPHGWQVTDCVVTLTHTGYFPRQSAMHQSFSKAMSTTAGDFRLLTPLVLHAALCRARTKVYAPVHGFRVEVPTDTIGAVLPALARLGAVPEAPQTRGAFTVIKGRLPAAVVDELRHQLPGLSRGEGVLESSLERYEPAVGAPPYRRRSGPDPADRKSYLLHVQRNIQA